ncbi:MAG: hypothetical protein NDF55_08820 [archaeon GB-1867-005]|nr:hypothetical protein [Candidatus Culexmicrobium cathedralense]
MPVELFTSPEEVAERIVQRVWDEGWFLIIPTNFKTMTFLEWLEYKYYTPGTKENAFYEISLLPMMAIIKPKPHFYNLWFNEHEEELIPLIKKHGCIIILRDFQPAGMNRDYKITGKILLVFEDRNDMRNFLAKMMIFHFIKLKLRSPFRGVSLD